MQTTLEILPIILAVLLWAGYHYYKDRHLPEPLSHYVACFGLGMAAAWISQAFYLGLGQIGLRYDAYLLAETDLAALFVYALFAIGPVEELAKFLPFLIVLQFDEFDDELDGIVYASIIALGFAAVENLNYLGYLTPFEAALRAFAAPLVHMSFVTIWGHYVGLAYLEKRSIWPVAIVSVGIAALLHGIYDFLVLAFPMSALPVATALLLAIWVWRLFLIRSINRRSGHG